jgi:hypothetical protein
VGLFTRILIGSLRFFFLFLISIIAFFIYYYIISYPNRSYIIISSIRLHHISYNSKGKQAIGKMAIGNDILIEKDKYINPRLFKILIKEDRSN